MYKGYQRKIHFTEKDPAQDPAFVKSLGVEISDNSVIVKSGDRMKIVDASTLYDTTFQKQGIVSFELEARLTGAIEYVLKDEDINVLFTFLILISNRASFNSSVFNFSSIKKDNSFAFFVL